MPLYEIKRCPPSELLRRTATLRRPLVLTNGVFDLLHRGHVDYLARAREMGASLLVAVNDDDSVRRLGKGPGRPFNRCEDRVAVLAALASTSLVTWFSDADARGLVEYLRPDVYVKGGDYRITSIPEGRAAIALGARVVAIPVVHYLSTSALAERIGAAAPGPRQTMQRREA